MQKNYIKRVELTGIHKRYDLEIDFNESLNILYGQNGTGKSTLIHIIANIANCDFIRFAFIEFEKIKLTYSNDVCVVVTQSDEEGDKQINIATESDKKFTFSKREAIEDVREFEDEKYPREFLPELSTQIDDFVKESGIHYVKTSYFPAFRTMLEAWSSQKDIITRHPGRRIRELATKKATFFFRNLFGQFLPTINYQSPVDIENNLKNEIRDCQIRIARYESSVFSDSFVKVFSALLEGASADESTDELLSEISRLSLESSTSKLGGFEENSNTYRQFQELVSQSANAKDFHISASGALAVYRNALKERQLFQQEAFKQIDTYCSVVNSFLEKKELAYEVPENGRMPKVGLKFPDETWSSIRVMSSGERQLLTMLYAVNRMSGNSTVLIDEPEISLHIDWQEDLLGKMMEQLGDRQVIVCTHSPAIAAGFDEYMKEVAPVFNDISAQRDQFLLEEEDEF